MDGWVHVQRLTDFVGQPGVGKTQLGIQLALNVQIPGVFFGLEGEAVYIDTEGSFMPERAHQMAVHLVELLHKNSLRDRNHLQQAAVSGLSASQLLDGIYVFRVFDAVEQLAVLHELPNFLLSTPKVKLLVIDSVAFHFRHTLGGGGNDYTRKLHMLGQMAQVILDLAKRQPLAAVLMNQVTTKVNDETHGSSLIPALGKLL